MVSRGLIRRVLLFQLIFLLVHYVPVYAAEWYIDKNSSGRNDGTSWTDAWRSFNDIVWRAGDTYYISGGTTSKTYNQSLVIGASGIPGNPIIIRPGQDNGHNGKVVITSTNGHGIHVTGYEWITIDGEYNGQRHIILAKNTINGASGLALTGSGIYSHIVIRYIESYSNAQDGINIKGPQNQSEIAYCRLYSNGHLGIQKDGGSKSSFDAIIIHDNDIYSNGADCAGLSGGFTFYNNTCVGLDGSHRDGIQCFGGSSMSSPGCSFVKIYGNIFSGIGHAAIFVDPAIDSSQVWIYNNVFHCDNTKVADCSDIGVKIKFEIGDDPNPTIDGIKIYNNSLVDQRYSAIIIEGRTGKETVTNVDIINNLLYRSHRIQVRNLSSVTNLTIENNVLFPRIALDSDIFVQGKTYPCTKAVYSIYNMNGSCEQPLLVNYREGLSGDYHLTSGDKVARDKGTDLSNIFDMDKDGTFRPQNTFWDIGAFEYSNPSNDYVSPAPPTNLKVYN